MKPENKIASFFNAVFVNFREIKLVVKIEQVVEKMNYAEKILLYISTSVFAITGIMLLINVNNAFLVEVPSFGGNTSEGVVGSPRFINPVIALSETDKDLVTLVYSGLLKHDRDSGFIGNLASEYQIDESGTVYDLKIRDNVVFHDGKKVTADDVVFTINKILDPIIKSQKRISWEGVRVEKISETKIRFTLNKPYGPFLEALTLGILPKHIWENVSAEEFPFSEWNLRPIGSGPYQIKKVEKNSGGIPISLNLSSFKHYALGQPKIKFLTLKFFQNENEMYNAYLEEEIEGMSNINQKTAKKISDQNLIKEHLLPRVFGVFFNQNLAPILANKEIREVLLKTTPKQRIATEVLGEFGQILSGPTPVFIDLNQEKNDIEEAKNILIKNGWKLGNDGIFSKKTKNGNQTFAFAISTSDTEELKKTVQILKEEWEKLGAKIDVKIFESSDLSQNIIRNRKYDALLFGEVVGVMNNLYPFWHSSQRLDPGLNISLYANITADKLLEEIQNSSDLIKNNERKNLVANEIKKDIPAIFLFSPAILYVPSQKIKNLKIKNIATQNERFDFVHEWYIETDKIWKFFNN